MFEQWFRVLSGLEGKRSMLEQWFRALSGLQALQKASSSSDFERPVAAEHVRAVISSAQSKKLRLCGVFECCQAGKPFNFFKAHRWFERRTYILIYKIFCFIFISLMCERLLVKRHLSKAPMDSKDHAGLELELELEVALAIALNLSRIRAALRSAYCQMEAWSHLTNQLGVSQPIKRASYSASQSCTQSGRPASSAAAAMAAAWVSADGHLLQMAAMAAAWILNASVVSASMRVSKRINHRTTQSSWEREIFGNCPWGAQTSANHWAIGCRSGSSYSA
jgi:hypothetical protein